MAASRRPSRPKLFDDELRELPPTSPVFVAAYVLVVVPPLIWILEHPAHLLGSCAVVFGLLATLFWAPAGTWANAVAWETKWECSNFAAWQRRTQAKARRLVALTARYAAVMSVGVLGLFGVGVVVDLPALLIVTVIGGLIVTVFVTIPLYLITGISSGALVPREWRDEEPARIGVLIGRLTAPSVKAHLDCAALGATLVAVALGLLAALDLIRPVSCRLPVDGVNPASCRGPSSW